MTNTTKKLLSAT